MAQFSIRPFRRADRDQLTDLINAHIAAVLPGASVSVNTVLTDLEHRPAEFIVDPWVERRATLVAEQDGRVVAASHVLRYSGDGAISDVYRDTGEIAWLVFWPGAPEGNTHWHDATPAARGLLNAAKAILGKWRAARIIADCSLPAPACYGVAEQWPHISSLYQSAGLTPVREETVLAATTTDLPTYVAEHMSPHDAFTITRTLGINGTRFTATVDDVRAGYLEVDTNLAGNERLRRQVEWADIGNLVIDHHDRDRTRTALLGVVRHWLQLAGIHRLLSYADSDDEVNDLMRSGFQRLTTITRQWSAEA